MKRFLAGAAAAFFAVYLLASPKAPRHFPALLFNKERSPQKITANNRAKPPNYTTSFPLASPKAPRHFPALLFNKERSPQKNRHSQPRQTAILNKKSEVIL